LAIARLLLLPLASAAPAALKTGLRIHNIMINDDDDELPKSPDDPDLWIYLSVAVALVLLGGAFAGLTIALMGQDETYLQVIATSGEGSERKNAAKVMKLLKKGKHWVLVTLLLSNVITNETLPIVLDRSLGGGWPAVVSSTILIVIFGEVAPQSICVRYGLSIGAYMAPFVLMLMWIMAPVAWPTAKLLDYLLGEDHGTMYKKAGLKTLVQLHKSLGTTPGERLMEDEVTIINSVLDLKDKPVGGIMTPMQDVFTMSADTVLDEPMMDTILSQGYSRIPIYSPDNPRNFLGMLLVKILITYDPEDCMRVRDFALATLPETAPYTSCLDIINFFQEGKSHMVLVSDFPGQDKGALGVVTLEDVIEELIGEEIIDESDVFVDVHKAIRRLAPAPKARFNRTYYSEAEPSDSEAEGKYEPSVHEAQGEDAPLLAKQKLSGAHKPSLTTAPSSQATFLMRRRSSAASDSTRDTTNPVSVRSNTADIRQHLKHLGPSNAASKPRTTKFTSVKIKPGVDTIPENRPLAGENTAAKNVVVGQRPVSRHVTEAVSVLKSNNGASDGVAAIAAQQPNGGYGTMLGTSPGVDKMSAQEASRIAQQNTSQRPVSRSTLRESVSNRTGHVDGTHESEDQHESSSLSDKAVDGGESNTKHNNADDDEADDDALGELTGNYSREFANSRVSVRSGSITETTVESGGMKKTVLETTSTPSENGSTASLRSPLGSNGEEVPPDEVNSSSKKQSNGAVIYIEGESNAGQESSKRRKKKSKSKKK